MAIEINVPTRRSFSRRRRFGRFPMFARMAVPLYVGHKSIEPYGRIISAYRLDERCALQHRRGAELGKRLYEELSSFQAEPIAAACLAQVCQAMCQMVSVSPSRSNSSILRS